MYINIPFDASSFIRRRMSRFKLLSESHHWKKLFLEKPHWVKQKQHFYSRYHLKIDAQHWVNLSLIHCWYYFSYLKLCSKRCTSTATEFFLLLLVRQNQQDRTRRAFSLFKNATHSIRDCDENISLLPMLRSI